MLMCIGSLVVQLLRDFVLVAMSKSSDSSMKASHSWPYTTLITMHHFAQIEGIIVLPSR